MAIKTWVGTTANWSVASNWSPAAVPTATDDLVFNNSAACNINTNYVLIALILMDIQVHLVGLIV